MPYYYAQLDENGVCVVVSALSGEVSAANMVPLTETEYRAGDFMGRTYAGGQWGSATASPPAPAPETLPPQLFEAIKAAVREVLEERGT